MSPEWGRRLGVLGSMALYGVACAIPAMALRSYRIDQSVVRGYECLYLGLYGYPLLTPVLAWLVNPFVWFLWVQGLLETPTNRNIFWIAGSAAVAAVIIIQPWARLLPGGYLWVASIALAGISCTPKELTPRERDFMGHFRYPNGRE